jgi:hypothetical protein
VYSVPSVSGWIHWIVAMFVEPRECLLQARGDSPAPVHHTREFLHPRVPDVGDAERTPRRDGRIHVADDPPQVRNVTVDGRIGLGSGGRRLAPRRTHASPRG